MMSLDMSESIGTPGVGFGSFVKRVPAIVLLLVMCR